jgi:hypothetical protein
VTCNGSDPTPLGSGVTEGRSHWFVRVSCCGSAVRVDCVAFTGVDRGANRDFASVAVSCNDGYATVLIVETPAKGIGTSQTIFPRCRADRRIVRDCQFGADGDAELGDAWRHVHARGLRIPDHADVDLVQGRRPRELYFTAGEPHRDAKGSTHKVFVVKFTVL